MAPQPDDDQSLLQTAMIAAEKAGELIATGSGATRQFEVKADRSIVTEVDFRAEQLIKNLIQERHPRHGFLGEEGGPAEVPSGFVWVVDPIDGTKNFLRGIPLYAVEIALLKDGIPYLGVSNLPGMRSMLWAVRGKGSYSQSGRLSVSKARSLENAYVSFGNLKHFSRKGLLEELVRLTTGAFQSRGIGDAWSFHLLADGRIDVFVDASTALWDIAALTVVVEEAGGRVSDLRGQPIGTGSNSVIATNALLHPIVLEHFQATPSER
jgi:histidinol-phosphatase